MGLNRQGLAESRSRPQVYFESAEVLSKVITKQRHNLLKVLHASGPLTVRALAATLERDYKNVHQDVKIVEGSGMAARDGKNHILAPYEKLTIEWPFTAGSISQRNEARMTPTLRPTP